MKKERYLILLKYSVIIELYWYIIELQIGILKQYSFPPLLQQCGSIDINAAMCTIMLCVRVMMIRKRNISILLCISEIFLK